MKKIALSLLLLCATLAATAQTTTLRATLKVERTEVKVGPYARFAQKYLGVVAPLADRTTITIADASLTALQEGHIEAQPALPQPQADMDFSRLPIDKRDMNVRSLDDAAREAALALFSLRKARIELVTGMAGENVFGDGLRAALDELDRLEAEYTALFLGKQQTLTSLHTFDVVPARGEGSRVIARFSPTEGLLASDDLTGEPITLEIRPVDDISTPASVAARPSKNAPPSVRTMLPAQVDCRLTLAGRSLASGRMAVWQMGSYIDVPAK